MRMDRTRCSLALCVMVTMAPAAAQENAGQDLHVGLILPTSGGPEGDPFFQSFMTSIEQGATMAQEEFAFNARMFGIDFQVDVVHADPSELIDASQRLIDEDGAVAIVGAVAFEAAGTLSEWAGKAGLPFVNISASGDVLRNIECAPTTFHVTPSAAMYLDALAGWYVRAGFRNWYFVQADTPEAEAEYERAVRALTERHFSAREAGRSVIAAGAGLGDALDDIEDSRADVVLLLQTADDQLRSLAEMEAAGFEVETTGFPYPETQTRAFFEASRTVAPRLGDGYRAVDWEPTLDAYGARELNARYRARWGVPMEGGAWAAYQAVKIVYEAAFLGGSATRDDVLAYLGAPNSVFDVWKGIGTSFRPWDHQLRQPVYLVKINQAGEGLDAGQLVGELPAIYMPGTDPVERLDQLGDLEARGQCGQ